MPLSLKKNARKARNSYTRASSVSGRKGQRGAKLPAMAWRGSRHISSRTRTRRSKGVAHTIDGRIVAGLLAEWTNRIKVPAAHPRMHPMTDQPNNPLHGITLERMLTELVARFGWDSLAAVIDIRCFQNEPSIKPSLKFLRRTPWAREQVEALYLREMT